eukprot:CAMPEP_0197499098 /NCGR_PEP_ID=MMETSP1311-20131121/60850_1 /TAXON_ID=464262 /ORGANISM="Genus nov. species nov., Strain RCC856" /LENGTH=204 /DNA_ID=CAMNT_0043044839 /DNA_START=80 /DNA_END=691 /DNA_ORIENTATION=-
MATKRQREEAGASAATDANLGPEAVVSGTLGSARVANRDLKAEEKAFEMDSLTRQKILFFILKLTRTDDDIKEAARKWVDDPVAAESRYGHISDWDVSRVTDMKSLFMNKQDFNEDLSRWQTGKVTNMSQMFRGASSFNNDLSQWDTGKVTNMCDMFFGASRFNTDLSKWQTGNVTDMSHMFWGATSFTSDLSKWNTSNVTHMT